MRIYSNGLSYTPSKQPNTSLLSTESPEQKFRGFLNLAVIILVVLNLRNILLNFQRYGNKLASGEYKLIGTNGLPVLGTLFLYVGVQFFIERLLFTGRISRTVCRGLTTGNVLWALSFHTYLCHHIDLLPIPGLFLTAYLMVIVLKIISYYQINAEVLDLAARLRQFKTNENYRDLLAPHEVDNENLALIAKHKDNVLELLSLRHLAYFVAAPTLCYQLSYPRNASIRSGWIAKRFIELLVILALQFVLWVQYYQPALDKLVAMIQTGTSTYMDLFQQLLEMSIPTILIWIGGFYAFFQVWLNILAEALRFADRRFYEDWWNCKNLIEYWKLWNLPVHNWFVRHMYNPLLRRGISKLTANLLVFLVSAVAHEYLVSVPLGVASYYAFLAMILQSPMIYLEWQFNRFFKLENSELGNVSFWVSYCIIGQPICVCIYYYLYVNKGAHSLP